MDIEMEYKIDRKVWQILWEATLGDAGFGWSDDHFENNTFEILPYTYDWGEHSNSYHFYHKPSGLKIQWYKYALRGASMNLNISDNQFVDVLYDCLNSLEEGKTFKFTYSVDKWWEELPEN